MKQSLNPQLQMQMLNSIMNANKPNLEELSNEERLEELRKRLHQKQSLIGLTRSTKKQKEQIVENMQQKISETMEEKTEETTSEKKSDRNKKKREKKREKQRLEKLAQQNTKEGEESDYEDDDYDLCY